MTPTMSAAGRLPLIRRPRESAQILELKQQGNVPSTGMSTSLEQTRCCRVHGRRNNTPIHILDNYSLLNIFRLYEPVVWDKDWIPGRFKLVHVCQRWRYLILGSASYLGICLVCTHATPVADMLENSPYLSHLPLIIDYLDEPCGVMAEFKEGVLVALQHREHVSRIRLRKSVPNLQKPVVAIDDEFPSLEYLYIRPMAKDNTSLTLPGTFQAPRPRHLILENFALPIESPVLTRAVGLVTLSLNNIPPSGYFHPNDLIHRVSLMPQLETLGVYFSHILLSLLISRGYH